MRAIDEWLRRRSPPDDGRGDDEAAYMLLESGLMMWSDLATMYQLGFSFPTAGPLISCVAEVRWRG